MKKDGFVLAEVVIAMAIFALCVTIALGYVGRGLEFSGKSRDLSRAMNIARLELSKIENIPFPPTKAESTNSFEVDKTDSDDTDFQIEVKDICYDSTGATILEAEEENKKDDITLRKIEINVYRKSDDKKMITLYTYITRNGLY